MAGSLMLAMFGSLTQPQGQQTIAQQAIPDAPRPQVSLPTTTVTPGQGASSSDTDAGPSGAGATSVAAPAAAAPAGGATGGAPPAAADQTPTYEPAQGQGADAIYKIKGTGVDEVDIPFTVKD